MWEVFLCKPAIYNLKMLGGENHKRREAKYLKLSGRKQKGKNMIFDLKLVERKTLKETVVSFYISRYHLSQISGTLFRIIRKKIFIANFYFCNGFTQTLSTSLMTEICLMWQKLFCWCLLISIQHLWYNGVIWILQRNENSYKMKILV